MQINYEYQRDNFRYPTWWKIENDSCSPHFHSSVEFTYVYDGEIKAVLNGKNYRVSANHILIAPSYTVHYYVTENHSKSIVIVIPLDFVPMFAKIVENKTFVQNICREDPQTSEIVRCIQSLLEIPCNDSMNKTVVKGYLYVILGLLVEKLGLAEVPVNAKVDLAKDVLVYLQNNYKTPLTLEKIADHFGYSKSRFSHIFNSLFGCGINQYISSLRCRNAAALMVEESVALIDAAMNSGFDSMRTFYRSFKQWYGITPTEYCENYVRQHAVKVPRIRVENSYEACYNLNL